MERVKDRMRYELYGWRGDGWLTKRRATKAARRIVAQKTNFFTGGVYPSNPPEELRQKFADSKAPPDQT